MTIEDANSQDECATEGCPCCGGETLEVRCKVVCAKCHRLIADCSDGML